MMIGRTTRCVCSRVALGALFLALTSATAATAGAETTIKIATLAPRGSIWMRYFKKMNARIAKLTNNAVKLRFYPGAVQGDERDVVRKMRTGQIHGAALTMVGLSMVNPSVLVLQMPKMFENYDKLDGARRTLATKLDKSFSDKGFELVGWGEVGRIYLFSKQPWRTIADLRKQKVWVWSDDAISKAMMRELSIKPIPLGLPQVLPSLQSGMIETVTGSPYVCLALQWHSRLKYVNLEPLAIGIGATVIKKSVLDQLTPATREIVITQSKRYHRALLKRIRRDNESALVALQAHGIAKLPAVSDADRKRFERAARKVAKSFAGRYYTPELLRKVRALR